MQLCIYRNDFNILYDLNIWLWIVKTTNSNDSLHLQVLNVSCAQFIKVQSLLETLSWDIAFDYQTLHQLDVWKPLDFFSPRTPLSLIHLQRLIYSRMESRSHLSTVWRKLRMEVCCDICVARPWTECEQEPSLDGSAFMTLWRGLGEIAFSLIYSVALGASHINSPSHTRAQAY